MQSYFWSNTVWYLALFIISFILLVITIAKSKNRKQIIVFYFAIMGLIYYLETLILGIFKSYSYYPQVFKGTYDDIILGNIVSQSTLATLILMIIVYNLPYIWYFVFALILFFIEKAFIKLGIYEIYWYKTYYTFIGFIFLSWFVKWWYIKVTTQKQYVFRYIELLLSIFAVYSPTINWVFELLRIQYFVPGFVLDPIRDHILGYFIYCFFLINIMINLYRLKVSWLWKIPVFIVLYLVQVELVNLRLLYIKEGWFFVCTTMDFLGCYFLTFVISNFSKSSYQVILIK